MADNIESLIDNFHKEKDGRGKIPILEKGDEEHHLRPEQGDPHDAMQTADSSRTRVADERHTASEKMHGTDDWLHKQGISEHHENSSRK